MLLHARVVSLTLSSYSSLTRGNVNRDKVGKREPVKKAHVDYTVASGPEKVHQLMGDEAEKLLKGRFAEVNVWQPLRVRPVSLSKEFFDGQHTFTLWRKDFESLRFMVWQQRDAEAMVAACTQFKRESASNLARTGVFDLLLATSIHGTSSTVREFRANQYGSSSHSMTAKPKFTFVSFVLRCSK